MRARTLAWTNDRSLKRFKKDGIDRRLLGCWEARSHDITAPPNPTPPGIARPNARVLLHVYATDLGLEIGASYQKAQIWACEDGELASGVDLVV